MNSAKKTKNINQENIKNTYIDFFKSIFLLSKEIADKIKLAFYFIIQITPIKLIKPVAKLFLLTAFNVFTSIHSAVFILDEWQKIMKKSNNFVEYLAKFTGLKFINILGKPIGGIVSFFCALAVGGVKGAKNVAVYQSKHIKICILDIINIISGTYAEEHKKNTNANFCKEVINDITDNITDCIINVKKTKFWQNLVEKKIENLHEI